MVLNLFSVLMNLKNRIHSQQKQIETQEWGGGQGITVSGL